MTKNNVFVGKDVIELVGNAMYLEPLTIYREYIQNSVDAIDDAVGAGLLSSPADGRIHINIDALKRSIIIRDNGTGILEREFIDRMLSIGGSLKRKTSARGFRGVGRLAGLGLCQELVFRSRAKGGKVRQISWDIRKMKSALAEFDGEGDIEELVRAVTRSETLDSEDFPDHFFEVELVSPLRLGQDVLINFEKIRNYVGQIAPVPFSSTFSFADKIRKFLKGSTDFREYVIFINDDLGQIYKPYEDEITYSETKSGQLREIDFFQLNSLDGEAGAVGWLVHHDYQGAIPKTASVGGLRARVGNIQVGEQNVFVNVFPEERFNSWTVGEVHIFDRRLIPNGRGDGFKHGNHFANLKSQLLPIGHKVAQHCRKESSLRTRFKRAELALLHAETIGDMLDQNAISKGLAKIKIAEARGKIAEARAAYDAVTFVGNGQKRVLGRIEKLEDRFSNGSGQSGSDDPLGRFSREKREAYTEIFGLIYACSGNQKHAKTLIDNVLKRL